MSKWFFSGDKEPNWISYGRFRSHWWLGLHQPKYIPAVLPGSRTAGTFVLFFFYSCYIFNWKASPRFPISCYLGCLMHLAAFPSSCCGSRWDARGSALTLPCSSLPRPQRWGGYMCRLQICTEGQLVLNCTRLKHFSVETLALLSFQEVLCSGCYDKVRGARCLWNWKGSL